MMTLTVEVDPKGRRVRLKRVAGAVDSGEAVNPDGIENQIEGGILQAASWTLHEPGALFLGTGEAAQRPTAAAMANAIADATGARLRDIPLTLS
jgi:CO/xanthine dehydrogenase Mo-binding subunit